MINNVLRRETGQLILCAGHTKKTLGSTLHYEEGIMSDHPKGFEIPGSTPSATFSRKPATYIAQAITTGQPILIIKRNRILAALVPINGVDDIARYLRACPLETKEVLS